MKNANEQTLSRNISLELKVKERIAELEAVNRELEAFNSTVSHDLQAPLRAIAGFSKILLTEYSGQLNRQAIGHLEIIDKNARRMKTLIRDLLAFSRPGKADITRNPVDMNLMVEEVLTELMATNEYSKAIVILQDLQPANCETSLTRQVWVNLVDNALKYSSKKENPVIEIGMTEVAGEPVYFVKDNGAGFDMEYADKLFDVFQRIPNQHEFEGSGIGLSTVNRIVTRHGGRVWAKAKLNEGSIFYFTLGKSNVSANT
jgi:two-component system sensor histidine kinase/response regulator